MSTPTFVNLGPLEIHLDVYKGYRYDKDSEKNTLKIFISDGTSGLWTEIIRNQEDIDAFFHDLNHLKANRTLL